MLLLVLHACSFFDQSPKLPEKIEGMWEVLEIETPSGVVDAKQGVLARYPGCSWARSTWTFDADHIQAGLDLLCRASEDAPVEPQGPEGAPAPSPTPGSGLTGAGDYYGCQVAVRVPAIWDTEAGSWRVEETVTARSRTRGLDVDAISVPTSCSLTLPAGEYQMAAVQLKQWRWEMLTPIAEPTNGGLFRLKLPDSDRPDFVAALKSSGASTETQPVGNP